jgi:hypothetical protein
MRTLIWGKTFKVKNKQRMIFSCLKLEHMMMSIEKKFTVSHRLFTSKTYGGNNEFDIRYYWK